MSEAPPPSTPTTSSAQSDARRALRARARVALALGDACARAELPGDARLDEDAPAQAVALYRDAVYWSLCAGAPETEYADLSAAFEGEIARVRTIVPDPSALRVTLVERSLRELFALPLAAQREAAAQVGAFARTLLDALDTRERQRRARITRAAAAVLAVASLAVTALAAKHALRDDFAREARWQASSATAGFPREGRGPRAQPGPVGAFFHTAEERAPWVSLDLGASRPLREVAVENRSDCCAERAIPLSVELSVDGHAWSEVARRTTTFGEWTARFAPRPARYVRLRAMRRTTLHLHRVSVR